MSVGHFIWEGFCPRCNILKKGWGVKEFCPPYKMDEGDFVYLGKNTKGILSTYTKMSKENSVRVERGNLSVSRLTPIYDIGSR